MHWDTIKHKILTLLFSKGIPERFKLFLLNHVVHISNISRIQDPSTYIQQYFMNLNPITIEYIQHPNAETQMLAAKYNAYVMQFVENMDQSVQEYVVRDYTYRLFEYIRHPSAKTIKLCFDRSPVVFYRYIRHFNYNLPPHLLQYMLTEHWDRTIYDLYVEKNPHNQTYTRHFHKQLNLIKLKHRA